MRVWGDYRLGLQEHVKCHRTLEPKGSPEWLSGRFKITQLIRGVAGMGKESCSPILPFC